MSDQIQENKDTVTEVTSVAAEEEKTGQKINVPSPEELVKRANISYIQNLKALEQLISARQGSGYLISRKGMNRLLLSILSLPMDDMKVGLQGVEEKYGFGVGQRLIADRFLLTQHHISEEIKKRKEAAANPAKADEVTQTQGENNE